MRALLHAVPGDAAARPQITLFGLSPIFEVGTLRGPLVVERTDRAGERLKVTIPNGKQLARGAFYDSAKTGSMTLTPGGTYLAI